MVSNLLGRRTNADLPVELAGVTAEPEYVTPEVAGEWLKLNGPNRNPTDQTWARYARDMVSNKWLFTGEPICFGESGRLLNGQHRLLACIEADAGFYTLVVRGIPNEDSVMDVLDSGKTRSLSHVLQIRGERSTGPLSAIVNMCWRYDTHRLGTVWPSREEALDWLANNEGVRVAVPVARQAYRDLKVMSAPTGAAYYLNARVDPEAADRFWTSAMSGEDLAAGDPILAYRRWVFARHQGRDKPRQDVWLAYNLKAMNAWRDGRTLQLLHMKDTEGLPELWS